MTNKSSHFKFTKKEISLNNPANGRKKENDSIKNERKYSELLIRILLSSKPYNNKIDNKKNLKSNNLKRKILFNKTESGIKNKNKSPKIKAKINFNKSSNSQIKNKNLIINKNFKTAKKETNVQKSIINKKIDEIKEIIKHNLNLNLETKFSFLKPNNSSSKEHIIYSPFKKNYNINKTSLNFIKINRDRKKYGLNLKNPKTNKLNITTYDRKYTTQQMTRTKTTENINNIKKNKSSKNDKKIIRKIKLMNYFSSNKLVQNNNKYINLTNREKSYEELNESENIKSRDKLKKRKIVYINLNKNNIGAKLRTENKEKEKGKKFKIIKNNKDSVKKKLLILINDHEQKKGLKQNNMTFYLSPRRLIDQIRTIKKLNSINKSTI